MLCFKFNFRFETLLAAPCLRRIVIKLVGMICPYIVPSQHTERLKVDIYIELRNGLGSKRGISRLREECHDFISVDAGPPLGVR